MLVAMKRLEEIPDLEYNFDMVYMEYRKLIDGGTHEGLSVFSYPKVRNTEMGGFCKIINILFRQSVHVYLTNCYTQVLHGGMEILEIQLSCFAPSDWVSHLSNLKTY